MKIVKRAISVGCVAALVSVLSVGPAHAVVRWSSWNDDCSGMTLQSSPQGYSYNKSWKYGNTQLTNYVNWGYVDHPYYRRSWNTGFPVTKQVYAQASLRCIAGAPYLTCS